MSSFSTLAKSFGKVLWLSLQIVVLVSLVCIGVGSIVAGRFSLALVFPGNFVAAAVIITVGLVIWFLPTSLFTRLNKSKLVDHSTVADYYKEERQKKQRKGSEILGTGLSCALISGVIQLLLWAII